MGGAQEVYPDFSFAHFCHMEMGRKMIAGVKPKAQPFDDDAIYLTHPQLPFIKVPNDRP